MKIALIQMPVTGDKTENIRKAREQVHMARELGAELAVLPEMFNCPYNNRSFVSFAEEAEGPTSAAMAGCAAAEGLTLVAGSIPEREDGRIYNTSFVFDPAGRRIARHRKMHLFDINISGGQRFCESDTFTPGSDVTTFPVAGITAGLCICFDVRFPELTRLTALAGAKLLIVPAAFNMTTGPMHWESVFRQRAVDDQLFTAGVAPARDETGSYVSYGNSILCSPWGAVMERAGAGEALLTAELDFGEVDRARCELPLLCARREDVYSLKRIN